MMEPPDYLSSAAQALWSEIVAAHPEALAEPTRLENFCAATARLRARPVGDRTPRACTMAEYQRAEADALGLEIFKEPARVRAAPTMVTVRCIDPEGLEGEYVGASGPVAVDLEDGAEAEVTDAYARHLVALGLAVLVR